MFFFLAGTDTDVFFLLNSGLAKPRSQVLAREIG
jgi:hypothetical protein